MSYSTIYDYIKNNKHLIFETTEINISILAVVDYSTQSSKQYRIEKAEVKNAELFEESREISMFISGMNFDIMYGEGFKLTDRITQKGWSIFYLLKEIITFLQKRNYNYFRGQKTNWETIPAIFREAYDSKGVSYFENFEELYKDIQRKFPDRIRYEELSEELNRKNIEKRANQLAVLQHYGLRTSLLDITSNPYIALLFMTSGNEMYNNLQLELYSIDKNCDLFTEVEVSDNNKRITAQKGAFLNYDFLKYKEIQERIKENKIKRVVINIDYDFERNKEANSDVKGFDKKHSTEKIIGHITSNLKDKLAEYGYEEYNLFPDFENYIEYRLSSYSKK